MGIADLVGEELSTVQVQPRIQLSDVGQEEGF
jgi:hypothetical protein